MSADEGIIATNDDATNCKRFAVKLGYWSDPYIQYFVRSADRRPPEINRGYYTRTETVKLLVERFLQWPNFSCFSKDKPVYPHFEQACRVRGIRSKHAYEQKQDWLTFPSELLSIMESCGPNRDILNIEELLTRLLLTRYRLAVNGKQCQVVNLGAGYDTLFWRLQDDGYHPQTFVEVDYPTVTAQKCYCIKNRKPLLQKVASEDDDIMISSCELHSDSYHIISCDLRNITEFENKLLKQCNLDKSLPTVFISECVLIYIDTTESAKLLNWISSTFSDVVFINYEQVNMDDRFGKVMVDNLIQRHCSLAGVDACKNLATQMSRFTDQGWDDASAMDMNMIYNKLPHAQIERIESLELMDEREIFEQLMTHYCITVGYKDSSNLNLKSVMLK